jgi:hypothetical protein
MHNVPHTIARISAKTHQIRPRSWAGSTELASNRVRSASGSTLVATHERPMSGTRAEPEAAQSMRHWHAEPPLAQIMPPVCLHQSPSSGAPASSSTIQLEICVPLWPLRPQTEQTFKPPRDLITPQCEEAGGRQAGEWFKPASKWTLEVHQLTASCLP